MEQRPEDVVAVAVVVEVHLAAGEVDGEAAAAEEELREGVAVGAFLDEDAGPTHPEHLVVVPHPREGADQAVRQGLLQMKLHSLFVYITRIHTRGWFIASQW